MLNLIVLGKINSVEKQYFYQNPLFYFSETCNNSRVILRPKSEVHFNNDNHNPPFC
ncbi:MAG: hypothetical protein IJ848_01505 [Alphaproteobacteria bacterium]|nr:hypothetical protein [Alphaproteobacteria bacterium]